MTPIDLRRELAVELGNVLDHMNFKDKKGNDCKIRVFEQNLPIQVNDNDTVPYPYLIVGIANGEIPKDQNKETVGINIIIGIYDNDTDAQGENIVLNIIQDIKERFLKNPLLKAFEMQENLKWAVPDEVTHPYYFAGMELYWTVPKIEREGMF